MIVLGSSKAECLGRRLVDGGQANVQAEDYAKGLSCCCRLRPCPPTIIQRLRRGEKHMKTRKSRDNNKVVRSSRNSHYLCEVNA